MAFIILLTLAYASLGSLTLDNFTTIGNQEGMQLYFIAYSFIVATYFFYYTTKAFRKYNYQFKFQKLISLYIYLSIIITPFIPYTETNPFLDDLHVFLAMSSSVLYLCIMFLFLFRIKHTIPDLEMPFKAFIYTLFLCFLFFGIVNSVVETLLVVAMSLFLHFILKN